jgi:hypothetical protein
LRAEGRDGVVEVVCGADFRDIWGLGSLVSLVLKKTMGWDGEYPEVSVALEVDLRAGGYGSAFVRPRSCDGRRAMDGYLSSCREAVVRSIVAAYQRRIVSIVTDTGAGHGIRISVDRSNDRQDQRGDSSDTHLDRFARKREQNEQGM